MSVSVPAQSERLDADLYHLVEEVAHLLPAQAPIRRFVHHNTLHHFQTLPFEEAVVQAARTFGCEAFPTETFFARERSRGRILDRDLDDVLRCEARRMATVDPSLPYAGWRRSDFRRFRLGHVVDWPEAAEIQYQLEEGDALRAFWKATPQAARESFLAGGQSPAQALSALWGQLCRACPLVPPSGPPVQSEATAAVHGLLIRLCGAYLDQGVGYWPMPGRHGLFQAFLELYSQPSVALPPWLAGLPAELRRKHRQKVTAEQALEEGLIQLGFERADWARALEERALSLRGWAGMVRQMEVRPDLAPVLAPPVRFLDFLAIMVCLEVQARGTFNGGATADPRSRRPHYELLYEAFVMAQLAGFGPQTLSSPEQIDSWLNEVRELPALERRRLLFLAYERRYRVEILDALQSHGELGEYQPSAPPSFQALFCIDDREESVRRHLEEIEPSAQTLGMAGFFGVRMSYQGYNDNKPLPLCPANQTPQHLVRELTLAPQPQGARALGMLGQGMRSARNGVFSGGLLAGTAGFLSGISLLGRTLAPGLFHRAHHGLEHRLAEPPPTRLKIERVPGEPPNAHGLWEGFTVEEMASVVEGSLRAIGARDLAPLFVIIGHGSSSLNNPHEAAHDCGATGGGRGGPNARAFAAMANHPEVRRVLAERGLAIPECCWFVGAYHNTCDDSMEYFDLDLVPESHAGRLASVRDAMDKACMMDAHERCRRFHNVPLGVPPKQAYQHVQDRAVTLAQPRPEYGHCTNSVCVVGRRERTRGLFLDRRAFLVSYDPEGDAEGAILRGLLEAVGPVGAGINLEYYFSSIDCHGYGCGTKLPHNITGLLGVMDGHSSDLRTGLPWQMVEIHEPMRLLLIVEAPTSVLEKLMKASAGLRELVGMGWIQLVAWCPDSSALWVFQNGGFVPHQKDSDGLPVVERSRDYYGGHRQHLPPARINAALWGRS